MKPGGGKQKGASFERNICKILSLWLSENTKEDLLWRSAMSGGRSTVARAKGKTLDASAGDISAIHPMGFFFTEKFYLECKHYSDLSIPGLIFSRGNLAKFWIETKSQACKYRKLPMMVAQQNRLPAFVCLDRAGLDILNVKFKCSLTAPRMNLYMVQLNEFVLHATRPSNGT